MLHFRLLYLASACFLSPYPVLLPQPLSQVITLCSRFRCFPLRLAFFRPPGVDSCYSDLRFSLFPSSRLPLTVVLPVPIYPPSVCLFPCALPVLVLSMLHLPFTVACFRHTAATQAPCLSFRVGSLPIVKTLGSGYLAWVMYPEN